MRYLFIFFSLLAVVVTANAQDNAWLIVPGKSVGQVNIAAPAQSLEVLGKPDGGDAAMMKAWRLWYGRKKDNTIDSSHMLAVFTAMRTQDTQYVKEIRVNSPKFKTAAGMGVGSAIAAVKKVYPGVKLLKTYVSKDKSRRIAVYDDKALGIAFETDRPRSKRPRCSMVVVHDPGEDAGSYLDFHTGFDNMEPTTPRH